MAYRYHHDTIWLIYLARSRCPCRRESVESDITARQGCSPAVSRLYTRHDGRTSLAAAFSLFGRRRRQDWHLPPAYDDGMYIKHLDSSHQLFIKHMRRLYFRYTATLVQEDIECGRRDATMRYHCFYSRCLFMSELFMFICITARIRNTRSRQALRHADADSFSRGFKVVMRLMHTAFISARSRESGFDMKRRKIGLSMNSR